MVADKWPAKVRAHLYVCHESVSTRAAWTISSEATPFESRPRGTTGSIPHDNEHSSSSCRLLSFIWTPSPIPELTYSRSLSPFQAGRPEGKRERECGAERATLKRNAFARERVRPRNLSPLPTAINMALCARGHWQWLVHLFVTR